MSVTLFGIGGLAGFVFKWRGHYSHSSFTVNQNSFLKARSRIGESKASRFIEVLVGSKSHQAELSVVELLSNIRQSLGMGIDLKDFSASQQYALFDLLILTMYADSHLTKFEDEQLQTLLASMGFTEEMDRQREFDQAVTRMRPSVQSIHKAKCQAILLGVWKTRWKLVSAK
jgi:hypothetical protein